MLHVEDVRFSYKKGREVLKGISFDLDAGDILCLLGSNGTGKTTLLRCMLGFHQPNNGVIEVNGNSIQKMSNKEKAHNMAYVPQSSNMAFPYTAEEAVLMGRVSHLNGAAAHSQQDWRVVRESMERLQISHLEGRRFEEMSGGEKQMVLVARALAQEAKVLIMDEPTANLDYHNQIKILSAIRHLSRQGLSILMTSHYPDHAFLACTKVALMKGGHIVSCGAPDDVVSTESLTDLYDTPVHVTYADTGAFKIKTCIPLLDSEEHSGDIEG
ncbi:ABC transporter ATP-binding protein [Eggerthellaceae bacterium zg-997]|nr:ABC transporter ATP-binding protein [Eggerthellaceae bacterium zg-997]